MRPGRKHTPESRLRISEARKQAYVDGRIAGSNRKNRVIPDVSGVPDDFGFWFSGFVDGEACFNVRRQSTGHVQVNFTVALRIDDIDVLEQVQRTLGFGGLTEHRTKTTWVISYRVGSAAHCMGLVALFRKFPLRSKKRLDFDRWSVIVEKMFHEDGLRFEDVERQVSELRAGRKDFLRVLESA